MSELFGNLICELIKGVLRIILEFLHAHVPLLFWLLMLLFIGSVIAIIYYEMGSFAH